MIPAIRQIHAKLEIKQTDGTWKDVTDYLKNVTVELGNVDDVGTGSSGVDSRVRHMTFELQNDGSLNPYWSDTTSQDGTYAVGDDTTVVGEDPDTVGDERESGEQLINLLFGTDSYYSRNSFSPLDPNSSWNYPGPLLWPYREIKFSASVTTPGVFPTEWVVLFHGYLGDSIQTDGPVVTCECRDLSKRLLDTYIEEKREYGSDTGVPAEDVIQQILDDNLGVGEVTLYCPVSPEFVITKYIPEYVSVWDAIQKIVQNFGWFLGYRWDSWTQQYRLTLIEPPRNKDASTADITLDYMDDFYTETLEITDRDIRNVITVKYRSGETGKIESITVSNSTSIIDFNRRAMIIEEADTSLIDTSTEATTLAIAALNDLKDLSGTTRINMPLLPEVDLFYGIIVHDPRIISTDDFYGIESVRHTLDFSSKKFRTEIIGSGKIIGAHRQWLKKEARPGAKKPIEVEELPKKQYVSNEIVLDATRAGVFDHFSRLGVDNKLLPKPERGTWVPVIQRNGVYEAVTPHIARLKAALPHEGYTYYVMGILNCLDFFYNDIMYFLFKCKLSQWKLNHDFICYISANYRGLAKISSGTNPQTIKFTTENENTNQQVTDNIPVNPEEWHDYRIIVTEQSSAKLYVDGQLLATHTTYIPHSSVIFGEEGPEPYQMGFGIFRSETDPLEQIENYLDIDYCWLWIEDL